VKCCQAVGMPEDHKYYITASQCYVISTYLRSLFCWNDQQKRCCVYISTLECRKMNNGLPYIHQEYQSLLLLMPEPSFHFNIFMCVCVCVYTYTGCPTRYRTRLAGGPLLRVVTIRRTTDTHYRHIPLHFSHNECTPVQSLLQYLHWC
jgi:hypothetical protein